MTFNKWEKRTLEKIIEVFFPAGLGERLNRDPLEAGSVDNMDFLISHYPFPARAVFHIIIWVTYWYPVMLLLYPLPFNFLNWQKRKKVLERMFNSKNYYIRAFANLLKLISAISYFKDTEARKQVGIPTIDDPIYSRYMGG